MSVPISAAGPVIGPMTPILIAPPAAADDDELLPHPAAASDAAASTATAEPHLIPPRREPAVSLPGRRRQSRSLLTRTARHHRERTACVPPFLVTMAASIASPRTIRYGLACLTPSR